MNLYCSFPPTVPSGRACARWPGGTATKLAPSSLPPPGDRTLLSRNCILLDRFRIGTLSVAHAGHERWHGMPRQRVLRFHLVNAETAAANSHLEHFQV